MNQSAGLRLHEDTTMSADSGSDVVLTASIVTPEWAPVDTVEFYINNQPERISDDPMDAARYRVCANTWIRRNPTINKRRTPVLVREMGKRKAMIGSV